MPDVGFDRARYRRILRFAAWHLAVTWWYELFLPRIGLRRVADRTRTARMRRFAARFRHLAVGLGGLMIKVGQYLSSRLDVLPPEITRELEGLQDEVPPVPFDAIRTLAERELGVPLGRVFATFDEQPIAAASLGQAYRATLATDDVAAAGFVNVVVKVQRPGIEATVAVDLAALRRVGRWLSRVRLVSSRANVPALMEEFAATSLAEIDYLNEASQAERFAANFADDPRVRTPGIAWERSTRRVLTLEDVSAIKISDRHGLVEAGIDPADVALVFAEVMFDQLFVHGFFHADPHPGNIFVTPIEATDGPQWALTFIDFGMMGELPATLKGTLRKLVIAAAARDGRGMVTAASEAGVLLPSADPRELERVMNQVFARFGGMGFAELREVDPAEFRRFALEFADVLVALPFQLPENFLLLLRTLSLTSGVASSLDPAYNIWDSVEPYAAQLLRDEGGNAVVDLVKDAVAVAGIAVRLPRRLDDLISRAVDGELAVRVPRVEEGLARTERASRRLGVAVAGGAALVAGAMLRVDGDRLGTALMVAAAVLLVVALWPSWRR